MFIIKIILENKTFHKKKFRDLNTETYRKLTFVITASNPNISFSKCNVSILSLSKKL